MSPPSMLMLLMRVAIAIQPLLLTSLALTAKSEVEDAYLIKVMCSGESGTGAPGTFSTLQDSTHYIRTLQPLNKSVYVDIQGDCVGRAGSLELDANKDSGSLPYTITYRQDPTPGAAKARLLSGTPLKHHHFFNASDNPLLPSSSAPYVLGYNLSAIDFGSAGIGTFMNGGLGECAMGRVELFYGGAPMMLARYPNAPLYGGPWMDWLHVADAGTKRKAPETYEEYMKERPPRVEGEGLDNAYRDPSELAAHNFTADIPAGDLEHFYKGMQKEGSDQGVWLHGFWSYDWADNYMKLRGVDRSTDGNASIWTFDYDPNTPPLYGVLNKARFYIVNSLSLLDSPGEYYIDQEKDVLYFYPPGKDGLLEDRAEVYIGTHNNGHGFVYVQPDGELHDVNFEGLSVFYSPVVGINLEQSKRIALTNLNVSNIGRRAISLFGAADAIVQGIVSSGCGCSAIVIGGGHHKSLVGANISVLDSDIRYYARITRTYNPGVKFSGVGFLIARNTIGFAPHNGLQGGAANLAVVSNTLYDLCYEVRDSGAFYIGRSWVNRGVLLQSNTFTNVKMVEPTFLGSPSVQAMYFDDEQSGVTARNNYCADGTACFLVGGGRHNTLSGNRCERVSNCVLFDNRGMTWQRDYCSNATGTPGELMAQLYSVNYTQPPYSMEYPEIVTTLSDRPCVPVQNVFIGNSWCKVSSGAFVDQTDAKITKWGSYASANDEDSLC